MPHWDLMDGTRRYGRLLDLILVSAITAQMAQSGAQDLPGVYSTRLSTSLRPTYLRDPYR